MGSYKIVTREEVENFILSQPDEREISFEQNKTCDSCGCLMIQYAKSELSRSVEFAGLRTFLNEKSSLIAEASDWSYDTWNTHHTNYKTLKEEVLRQQ